MGDTDIQRALHDVHKIDDLLSCYPKTSKEVLCLKKKIFVNKEKWLGNIPIFKKEASL